MRAHRKGIGRHPYYSAVSSRRHHRVAVASNSRRSQCRILAKSGHVEPPRFTSGWCAKADIDPGFANTTCSRIYTTRPNLNSLFYSEIRGDGFAADCPPPHFRRGSNGKSGDLRRIDPSQKEDGWTRPSVYAGATDHDLLGPLGGCEFNVRRRDLDQATVEFHFRK